MIHSMTAFTRHSVQKTWGSAVIELRTVNHRYFEMDLRLPEPLRELEMPLRERAGHYLRRGKIECHLRYKPADTLQQLSINEGVLQQLARAGREVAEICRESPTISLTDLLSWPGVLETAQVDRTAVTADMLALFDEVLQGIGAVRLREGQALKLRIEERLQQVMEEVALIKQRLPVLITQQRSKITAKIEEFKLTIDDHRLEEEILHFLHKMDIAEEIERLEIHVEEVRLALKTRGAVGRRLDFLMQELHREANTLGSKSSDTHITHAAIHLKVLIEQMREQVQNVE